MIGRGPESGVVTRRNGRPVPARLGRPDHRWQCPVIGVKRAGPAFEMTRLTRSGHMPSR
jgi:hypothetical protein